MPNEATELRVTPSPTSFLKKSVTRSPRKKEDYFYGGLPIVTFLLLGLGVLTVLDSVIQQYLADIRRINELEENALVGEWTYWKPKRLQHINWSKTTEVLLEERSNLNVHNAFKRQTFKLHIQLRTECNKSSLDKIMSYLNTAAYGNDIVLLTIITANCQIFQHGFNETVWKHGPLQWFHLGSNSDPVLDPLRLWWPPTPDDHLFYIPASARLSPGFYTALKTTAMAWKVISTQTAKDRASSAATRKLLEQADLLDPPPMPSLLGVSLDPLAKTLAGKGVPGGVQGGALDPGGKEEAYLTYSLAEGCQLLFPEEWKRFWEWHDEAHGSRMESDEGSAGRCRKDWQSSLLTHSAQFNVFNLHAAPHKGGENLCILDPEPDPILALSRDRLTSAMDAASITPEILPVRRVRFLPQFDSCGLPVPQGRLILNPKELKRTLGPVSRDGALAAVMVSPGFEDMLTNWLCFVKDLGLRNFFVITQDRWQARRLKDRGLVVYAPPSILQEGGHGHGHGQPLLEGSLEYKRMLLARATAVGDVLHAGFNVLLADVDAVWLADPFEYFKVENVDIFAVMEGENKPSGGFLYLIRNKTVKRVWDLVIAMLTQHVEWLDSLSKSSLAEFQDLVGSGEKYDEQRFLQDILRQGRDKVTFFGLNPIKFIRGRDYFDRRRSIKRLRRPVVIHNNNIFGKGNKTRRFRWRGFWRVHARGDSCECLKFVCHVESKKTSNGTSIVEIKEE